MLEGLDLLRGPLSGRGSVQHHYQRAHRTIWNRIWNCKCRRDVPELQIWPYFGVCKYLVDVDPEECREVMFPYIIAMNAFLLVIAFMLLNALCIWTLLDDETDDHKIRKKQRKIKNILKAWLVLDLIHRLIEIAFNHWLGYPSNASSFCVYMAYMGFRAHGWIVVYLLYQKHKNKCREQGLENGDNPENATDTSLV